MCFDVYNNSNNSMVVKAYICFAEVIVINMFYNTSIVVLFKRLVAVTESLHIKSMVRRNLISMKR